MEQSESLPRFPQRAVSCCSWKYSLGWVMDAYTLFSMQILGTDGDYLVAEGVLKSIPKAPDAPEKPPVLPDSPEFDVEPRGEGSLSVHVLHT